MTGAARGLGLTSAKLTIEAGGAVALAGTLGERVQEEAVALHATGFDAYGFTSGLGDSASIQTCAMAAAQILGGLNGLVSSTAITDSGGCNASSIDIKAWDRAVNVSVRDTWLATMACLPAPRTSGHGAIANLSSDIPLWGASNLLAHVASKSAAIGMAKSLAREYGADDITVNAIAPGSTLVKATEYVSAHCHALYRDQHAISRDQLPNDVYGVMLFALSDFSRFVTGQTLAADGGFIIQ